MVPSFDRCRSLRRKYQTGEFVDRPLGRDELVEARLRVHQVAHEVGGVHRRGEQARHRLAREAIHPRVEVARDVPRHVRGDLTQGLVLALERHPPHATDHPAPVLELLLRALVLLALEAADLVVGAVVEDQLDRLLVVVALHQAAHDLLHDVLALAVEPEDLRIVRLGHVGSQPRQAQGLGGQKLQTGREDTANRAWRRAQAGSGRARDDTRIRSGWSVVATGVRLATRWSRRASS